MHVIWNPIIHKHALFVPYVSISWPKDGQEWPKHVATIINKPIYYFCVRRKVLTICLPGISTLL